MCAKDSTLDNCLLLFPARLQAFVLSSVKRQKKVKLAQNKTSFFFASLFEAFVLLRISGKKNLKSFLRSLEIVCEMFVSPSLRACLRHKLERRVGGDE